MQMCHYVHLIKMNLGHAIIWTYVDMFHRIKANQIDLDPDFLVYNIMVCTSSSLVTDLSSTTMRVAWRMFDLQRGMHVAGVDGGQESSMKRSVYECMMR